MEQSFDHPQVVVTKSVYSSKEHGGGGVLTGISENWLLYHRWYGGDMTSWSWMMIIAMVCWMLPRNTQRLKPMGDVWTQMVYYYVALVLLSCIIQEDIS